MKILHVSCSPRGQAAESYRLGRRIIELLRLREPAAITIERSVGGGALAHVDEGYALALGSAQQPSAQSMRAGSLAHSEDLIQELEAADCLLISTPMHNFTVPSGLKAWIDHIVRIHRSFNPTPEGKVGTLRNRPVFVAISSGGRYSGERARQPDFLTPYLTAILRTIGLHDVTFFSVEGTAPDADALAAARGSAEQALQEYFALPAASHATPSVTGA